MNLDDKFKELKEEIPEVDSYLGSKIYAKGNQKQLKRNPILNKLTISICGIILVVLMLIIGPISYNNYQTNQMKSTVTLLKSIEEPTKLSLASPTLGQFYEELNHFSGVLSSLCLEELNEESNAVLSPASIFSALALAIECCDGNTRNELLNAIGMEYSVLEENYARFYENLNALEQETNQTKRKLTNSIWLNKDFSPKENCLSNLADKYYCYSHGVDFKKTEYVNKYITDFISKQTNGFLKPNLNLSPETIFMLLNTLYLRDSWNSRGDDLPFTKEEYKFKNADGTTLSQQFLRGYYKSGKAKTTSTYRQFYTTTNEYRLSFIVPLEGYRIEDVFTPTVISDISKSDYTFFNDVENEEDREFYYTRCLFPEFSVSSSFSLENIFKKLGILDLFNHMNADFSNLSDSRDLCCTNATHLAKLVVNKKGIEGAAVTYLEAATSAGPVKEIFADFIVDRSFGFVISNFAGVNLFSGIIRQI